MLRTNSGPRPKFLGPRTVAAVAAAASIAGCGGGGSDTASKYDPTVYNPGSSTNPTNSCSSDPACVGATSQPSTSQPQTAQPSPRPGQIVNQPANQPAAEPEPTKPQAEEPPPSQPPSAPAKAEVTSDPPPPTKAPETSSPPKAQPVNRHDVDMPDDVQGQQIHVIYAVPKGSVDRALDLTDRFTNSIGSINGWLRKQTGDTLEMKLDTYQGRVDITHVSLPKTDTEYESWGDRKLLPIQDDLVSLGQIKDGKIYYVYYDGDWSVSCGTSSNSMHGGKIAVQFVQGLSSKPGVNPCENNPKAQSESDPPTYLDRVVLHELLHLIGIPHVGDSPTDLMYGYEYGVPKNPPRDDEFVLDYGKNDYAFDRSTGSYALGRPNIYDSPFFRRIIH